MQVNSISSSNASFGSRLEDRLHDFANLSDRDISQLALQRASRDVNTNKAKRVNRLLWLLLPIASGVSAATRGKMPRMERVTQGLLSAIGVTAALGTADAAFLAQRKLEQSSSKVKDFNSKHPFMAFLNTAALGLGSFLLLYKGGSKLFQKYGTRLLDKNAARIENISQKLDTNKFLNSTSKFISEKVPNFVKKIGSGILNWAPWLVILAAFGHSSASRKSAVNAYTKNYDELKTAQMQVRELYKEEAALNDVQELADM